MGRNKDTLLTYILLRKWLLRLYTV